MYVSRKALIALTCYLVSLCAPRGLSAPPDDQYGVAASHYTHGRWQLAVEEFQGFLKQYPDDRRSTSVLFFLGESLVQLQRYEEAQQRFREFLERSPDERYALQAEFRLGEIAFLRGERAEAKERLEGFRAQHAADSLNAYALAYLGEISIAENDGARAEAFYREAIDTYRKGPLDRECRFGLARALEMQGQFDEAIRFYRFLADHDRGPMADDAQLQIGALLFKQGKPAEAVETLKSFSAIHPGSDVRGEAGYWLGQCYAALNRWAEASEAFSASLQDAPENPLAPAAEFSLGEALRKQDQADAAEPHYLRVVEKWPECEWADDALQVLAEAALQKGDAARAEELARRFLDKHANGPLVPYVRQTLGRALLKQQRFDDAIRILAAQSTTESGEPGDSAPEEKPRGPGDNRPATDADLSPIRRANAYYLALAFLGSGQFDAALAGLDGIQPAEGEKELAAGLLVARASALIALKRFGEAVAPLQTYLAANPRGEDAADCTARLTMALAETGDWAAATATYDRFREQFAAHELFLPTTEYLAERAQSDGQAEWAQRLFTVLAENEKSPEYAAKGLVGLGRTQLKAGDAGRSADTFAELLRRAPDSPEAAEAAFLRAKSLEASGKLDEALTAYRAVIDGFHGSPQVPVAMLAAAQLQESRQQYDEARKLLEPLVADYPGFDQHTAALYHLAWIHVELNQPAEADAAFARVAEEGGGTRYWADATYRLAERAAEQRDYAAARQRLDQLLASKAEPDVRAHALYLQGKVAADELRWADVPASMQQVLDEFPEHPLRTAAEYWLAEALFRQEKYEAAATVLARLDEATKNQSEAWLAMVPLRRAQTLAQLEKWQEAAELAGTIAARFPDFRQQYEVDYLLGRCLSSQARFSDAREAYQRVIRSPAGGRTETAAMAQWMIGETYFHQKDYEQAIRAYYRVESLYAFPKWQAAALLQAAKCHELTGQPAEAARLYSQLIKDYPDTNYAADAAERMKSVQTARDNPPRTARELRNNR